MLKTDIYKQQNYLLDIPYMKSSCITEYDLSKANINALRYTNTITDEEYQTLYNMPKRYRERYIGLMISKDKEIYHKIQEGIIHAKELFFDTNNVEQVEVLSIKNDAIFLLGNRHVETEFENFTFKNKGTYTFFMCTSNKVEIYYGYDAITDDQSIEIKGINDSILELHKDYFITFLCNLFYTLQSAGIEVAINFYNEFYDMYVNRQLDVGFYREFNNFSKYSLPGAYHRLGYGVDFIEKKDLDYVLIDTNVNILRDIYSVLADIYFANINPSRY